MLKMKAYGYTVHMHAVAMIRNYINEPEDFVDNCYTIKTNMNYYNNIMNPWMSLESSSLSELYFNGEKRKKEGNRLKKWWCKARKSHTYRRNR